MVVTANRPGVQAVAGKGWLGAHRWLLLRRGVQLGVLALFLLGGEAIRPFSQALIIGVVIGTYSSIYVASATALQLDVSLADLAAPVKRDDADEHGALGHHEPEQASHPGCGQPHDQYTAAITSFSQEIHQILANLKKRVFFLKSAHLDDIRLFSTRWVLSYLKGPLKRADIAALMADRKPPAGAARDKQSESVPRKPQKRRAGFDTFVTLDNSITQLFRPALGDETGYRPGLLAHANLHYFSQARSIDLSESLCLSLPLLGKEHHLDWGKAEKLPETQECLGNLPTKPPSEIRYAPVPDIVAHDRNLSKAARELSEWIYRTHRLELYRVRNPKLESRPGESLGDFKVRINDLLSDRKEAEIGKLKERYAKKEKTLLDRLDRAMTALDKEKSDSTGSLIKAGITVLGVLFGKSRASVGTAGTRVLKERGDISRAEERVQKIQMDIDALEAELWEKIDELDEQFNIEDIDIEEFSLKLRKTDIDIDQIALVWSTD